MGFGVALALRFSSIQDIYPPPSTSPTAFFFFFFLKISIIDKTLARLVKIQREKNKIRNERGNITTDTTEIQKIMRLS